MNYTEEEINQHTPMIQAYLNIKKDHQDKLVFYRMGDFYEMFFNDAYIAQKILGINATFKGKNGDNPIPMAGIPFHAVDGYLTKAISKGCSVVLCDQYTETVNGKDVITRKVSKIITPGTVIDSGMIDDKQVNYLLSLYKRGQLCDVSWTNFSSGQILYQTVGYDEVIDFVDRIGPSEVLVSDKQRNQFGFDANTTVTVLEDWRFDKVMANSFMIENYGESYAHTFGLVDNINIVCPIALLLGYLQDNLCEKIQNITSIKKENSEDFIQLSSNTKKHLELIYSNNEHTLFNTLDHCATPMGSRLLKEWLSKPIRNKKALENRLKVTEYMIENHNSWFSIADMWCDIERIATRISLKSVKPRELAALRQTLRTMPQLREWANNLPLELKGFFNNALIGDNVKELLEKYLLEDPSIWIRDGEVINSGIDKELDECRNLQKGHSEFLQEYENAEKLRTGIANLKVEFNSNAGFYISISNSHLDKIPDNYTRKQTLKNAERFTTKELKEYEEKALSAKERSLTRERILFFTLLDKLGHYVPTLQKQAKILSQWDIFAAFGKQAKLYNYTKPIYEEGKSIFIMENGRHPVVEIFKKDFVPNSMSLEESNNLAIITGPNMGGKSTIMRQLALITIMSHIGSYVPADKFVIGDIDAIYTRIGAQDDLAGGRSTFMVEMSESAYILNHATEKSLVLLDELGRGTATYDGLSLAWSIANHLANTIKCHTMFATHYLEMTTMSINHPNIINYRVSATEENDEIKFNHIIELGAASRSYGLNVAKLAGIPQIVLEMANKKLKQLENEDERQEASFDLLESSSTINNTNSLFSNSSNSISAGTTSVQDNSYISDLKQLDLNNMTPIQAFVWLQKQKDKL